MARRPGRRVLRTSDLASRFQMNEKQVRKLLRSMPEYDDAQYTQYEFTEDDVRKIAVLVEKRRRHKMGNRKVVVTSKGQLVIPAAIRRRYHIRKGTQVHIEEIDSGILLRPITDHSIERVRGILGGKDLPDRIEKEPDRDIR